MALTGTTLTAAILPSDTTWAVTSTTGFIKDQAIRLDSEYCYVAANPITTTQLVVRSRGAEGTAAAPHAILTNVITGTSGADFPSLPVGGANLLPTYTDDVVTIGANTAIIAVPMKNTTFIINKATALSATTLAAPTLAQNGLQLKFISTTAAAHVITGATLFDNGITGVPWSTVTFAAFAGAGFTATAVNGLWHVNAIPIAAAVVLS